MITIILGLLGNAAVSLEFVGAAGFSAFVAWIRTTSINAKATHAGLHFKVVFASSKINTPRLTVTRFTVKKNANRL